MRGGVFFAAEDIYFDEINRFCCKGRTHTQVVEFERRARSTRRQVGGGNEEIASGKDQSACRSAAAAAAPLFLVWDSLFHTANWRDTERVRHKSCLLSVQLTVCYFLPQKFKFKFTFLLKLRKKAIPKSFGENFLK
jgi:hypothetical protein